MRPDPNCSIGDCGGYGGWWAKELGEGVSWEIHPSTQDDSIGYVICPCLGKEDPGSEADMAQAPG